MRVADLAIRRRITGADRSANLATGEQQGGEGCNLGALGCLCGVTCSTYAQGFKWHRPPSSNIKSPYDHHWPAVLTTAPEWSIHGTPRTERPSPVPQTLA